MLGPRGQASYPVPEERPGRKQGVQARLGNSEEGTGTEPTVTSRSDQCERGLGRGPWA